MTENKESITIADLPEEEREEIINLIANGINLLMQKYLYEIELHNSGDVKDA